MRAAAAGLVLATLAMGAAPPRGAAREREASAGEGLRAVIDERTTLVLKVQARAGEGWWSLARRLGTRGRSWEPLAAANPGIPAPRAGGWYVVPPDLWPADSGRRALAALFPRDTATRDGGWRHVVTDGRALGRAESPWALAALFLGDGRRHAELATPRRGLKVGDAIVVPRELLLPHLRPAMPGGGEVARLEPPAAERPASAGEAPTGSVATLERESSPPADAPDSGGAEAGPAPPAAPSTGDAAEPATSTAPAVAEAPIAGGGVADAPGSASVAQESLEQEPPLESVTPEPPPVEEPDDEDVPPPSAAREPATEPAWKVTPGSTSDDGLLVMGEDGEGPYAAYRIQKGETLYTHVVMRFTGLLSGRDVNDAARRFAARSGIADVTAIAVGQAVKIPLGDLAPQHLPQGHPRRTAWEEAVAASERLARVETRRNLEGVHVILDAGHGGSDPGAGGALAWEDDFAYDVACRVLSVLRDRTLAVAHPLVKDLSSGWAPIARPARDTDEVLLTTPPYALASPHPTAVAVNLRWVLANDVRRRLMLQGVPDDRIVFLSIHADSLHPAARGVMAYYPSARLRPLSSDVPRGAAYAPHAEVQPANGFRMSRAALQRAEGLSRRLATALVDEVRAADLLVHGFSPVRGEVVRGRAWVPAVLRYNRTGASVLFEACNLNNPDDARTLRDPAWRQDLAEALVSGLERYFEGGRSAAAVPREARK